MIAGLMELSSSPNPDCRVSVGEMRPSVATPGDLTSAEFIYAAALTSRRSRNHKSPFRPSLVTRLLLNGLVLVLLLFLSTPRVTFAQFEIDNVGAVLLGISQLPSNGSSEGSLFLPASPATDHVFRWVSSDSTLGQIDTGFVQATEWRLIGNPPTRLVFSRSDGDISILGNVLLGSDSRAIIDVRKGVQRVRYLLDSKASVPNPPLGCFCASRESNTSECHKLPIHLGGAIGGETAGNIYAERGEFFQYATDLEIPGRPGAESMLHYSFQRRYRAHTNIAGRLGYNWDHNYFERLEIRQAVVIHHDGLGRSDFYLQRLTGDFLSPPEFYTELVDNDDGSFTLHYRGGTKKLFDSDGKLREIRDRKNNYMTFHYDAQNKLALVNDTLGRDIEYSYLVGGPNAGRLHEIKDFIGRSVTFHYDSNGDLVEVTSPAVDGTPTGNDFPAGKTTHYTYSSGFSDQRLNHNLLTITRPNEVALGGAPVLTNVYGADLGTANFDKVIEQSYGGSNASGVPAGGTFHFEYQTLSAVVVSGRSNDPTVAVARTTETDRNGNIEEYEFNVLGYPLIRREFTKGVRSPEPALFESTMEYNSEGELILRTLPEGDTVEYTYDETSPDRLQHGNLLSVVHFSDPDRPADQRQLTTTYTYEPSFNQVKTITDPRGNDDTFVPANGGLNSPERYRTIFSFDYEERDNKLLNPDSLEHGNIIRIRQPTVRLHNGASQEIITEFKYNDFGQKILEIDPEGNVDRFFYYPEQDPDGDGDGSPGTRIELHTKTGGYLRETAIDTMDSGSSPRRTIPSEPVWIRNQFLYDPVGNVIRSTDGRGITTRYVVNSLNQTVQTIRAANVTGTFDVDPPEPLPLVAFAYIENLHYDFNDNIVRRQVEDRGDTSNTGGLVDYTYTYDILDKKVAMTEEVDVDTQLHTRYRYDPNENLVMTIHPEGNADGAVYDERDLLEVSARGIFFRVKGGHYGPADGFSFDRPGGRQFLPSFVFHNYDQNRNELEVVDSADTDDSPGNQSLIDHPLAPIPVDGDSKGHGYDGFNRIQPSVDAVGNESLRSYDPASNIVEEVKSGPIGGPSPTDNNGTDNVMLGVTEYKHDELNRVFQKDRVLFVAPEVKTQRPVDVTDGPLTPGDQRVTTITEYDRNSRVVTIIEDDLHRTVTEYDGADRVVKTIDPEGNIVEFAYDDNNNLIKRRETDVSQVEGVPDEVFVTAYFYDSLNRLERTVDNIGQTTYSRYDSRDNLVAMADAQGPETGTTNLFGNSFGNVTTYSYDGIGRKTREDVVLTVSGQGDGVHIGADIFGVKSATPTPDPTQGGGDGLISIHYEWDRNSLLARQTDDNGNQTRYRYDNHDRLFKVTKGISVSPNLADRVDEPTTITYFYDQDDNIVKVEDENGTVTETTFDGINRRTNYTITRAPGIVGTTELTFQFDGLSRMTLATDNNEPADPGDDSVITFAYDSQNRVVEETQQIGALPVRAVSSAWTADDRTGITYPNGRALSYIHDGLDRIDEIWDEFDVLPLADYDYIGSDRVLIRRYQNGTRLTYLDNANQMDSGYDGLRRLVQERHLRTGNTLIAGAQHGYDRMNNILDEQKLHDPPNDEVYAYESAYRLTKFDRPNFGAIEPSAAEWTLDGVGNWERVDDEFRLHSSFNELIVRDEKTLEYDNNGNLVDDGEFILQWDYKNRLRSVIRKADGELVAVYAYDALNRRVRKDVSNSTVANGITDYYYDSWQVVEERDLSDTLQHQYVYGIYIDETLILDRNLNGNSDATEVEDQRLFYHESAHYSPYALTNVEGVVVEGYQYGAYGDQTVFLPGPNGVVDFGGDDEVRINGVSEVGNPYLFTGRRFDPETRLYHFRSRYYSAALGRFISRDPEEYHDGMGLYEYAGSQPLTRYDPLGLGWWSKLKKKVKRGIKKVKRVLSIAAQVPSPVGDIIRGVKTVVQFVSDVYTVGVGTKGKFLLIHGNWCGPGNTGLAPIDALDRCCQIHDKCFDACGIAGVAGALSFKACAVACDTAMCLCTALAPCGGNSSCEKSRRTARGIFCLKAVTAGLLDKGVKQPPRHLPKARTITKRVILPLPPRVEYVQEALSPSPISFRYTAPTVVSPPTTTPRYAPMAWEWVPN